MPQARFGGDVNNLTKGFITEASPLNFPEGASLDEVNIKILKTGERARREGMDYEDNYVNIQTDVLEGDVVTNYFLWKNPDSVSDLNLSVLQFGGTIYIFDSTSQTVSSSLLYSQKVLTNDTTIIEFASVDGMLVASTNSADILVIKYSGSTNTFSLETNRLKVRDLFGLEDIDAKGNDLREGSGIDLRPANLSDAHLYNLRNQTWNFARIAGDTSTLRDPIDYFKSVANKYPSNADNVIPFLMTNANNESNRTIKRFYAEDLYKNPLGSTNAPKGYFIIDLLKRGQSRKEGLTALAQNYGSLSFNASSFKSDYTPLGASCVASYAGRIFYAGFSNEVVNGDAYSPKLGSYVLFSQLVKSPQNIFSCYQEGDPTSSDLPDLIDTDGGFVKIDGASDIKRIIPLKTSLFILASNGIWMLDGGSNYGFTATNYKVAKISNIGCISKQGVVISGDSIIFFGEGGIYVIQQDQYGDWQLNSITDGSILSWYDNLSNSERVNAKGYYEPYTKEIRWLINVDTEQDKDKNVIELIFDISSKAFTKYEIFTPETDDLIKVNNFIEVSPFQLQDIMYYVVDNAGNHVISESGENVIIYKKEEANGSGKDISTRRYLIITSYTNEEDEVYYSFSFGNYSNKSFRDFYSYDELGVDAKGYLLTGYVYNQDLQRYKQLPYLTVYSRRTETGFSGEWIPQNQGSIQLSVQWNWTDDPIAGKWTNPVQAYRILRTHFQATKSSFENGNPVVITKNKIRGRGRTLSILFETEEGKDFQLLGYSLWGAMNQNV